MKKRDLQYARCLAAELLGTFILVFIACGISSTIDRFPEQYRFADEALTVGATLFALIFTLGEISGAHFNPTVTFAFALRGVFPWKKVLPYILAQITGGVIAACCLAGILGLGENIGALGLKSSVATTFECEIVLSFFLVTVILFTTHEARIKGADAAFPVASTLAFCSFFGKPYTGAAMNSVRAFAPALVSQTWEGLWIYLTAPFAGAALAVLVVRALAGRPKPKDIQGAQGEAS